MNNPNSNRSKRNNTNNSYHDSSGKMKKGNPGRPKGSKDKFTDLKDAFLQAFYDEDGIGGAEGIKQLIQNSPRNKMVFLQMIAKMLPTNVTTDVKAKIDGKLKIEVVKTK